MVKLDTKKKRKQPPTFRHFKSPVQAKIAKRAWVEKVKIKSKWKTEKRKLVAGSSSSPSSKVEADKDDGGRLDVVMGQEDTTDSSNSSEDVPLRAQRAASDRSAARDGHGGENGKGNASGRTGDQHNRPPRRATSASASGQKPDKPQASRGDDDESFRELFRKAYSRESLHTYKSDPLHRGKGRPAPRRGGTKGMGRGQPDMKLRMNVLLEKLKRDVAAG